MSTTPSGPAKQPGKSCTTGKGPHGGGNKFTQGATLGGGFIAVPPIKGHTQKGNVKTGR